MEHIFNLHWLREGGCDRGTLVSADQLDPSIRDRVLQAAQGAHGVLTLKLPFLDQREVRRRSEVLGQFHFERSGNEISAVLTSRFTVRTAAAEFALNHPAWTESPGETDLAYFHTWQTVSQSLQTFLRTCLAREYFREVQTYADRDAAYPWIVYQAARIFRGHAPHEFSYDLRDFPDCLETLESTWSRIGVPIQKVLARIETRLYEAGHVALARRYAPRWAEDVLREVQRRPAPFYKLMAVETDLIDAMIELGTSRSTSAVCRFAKIVNLRFRNLHGCDVRAVAIEALHETTRVLSGMGSGNSRPDGLGYGSDIVQPGFQARSFQNSSASDLRT